MISIRKMQYSYKEFLKMKKPYIAPTVTTYGSVESITEARGSVPVDDNLIINGVQQSIPTDGSTDIDISF